MTNEQALRIAQLAGIKAVNGGNIISFSFLVVNGYYWGFTRTWVSGLGHWARIPIEVSPELPSFQSWVSSGCPPPTESSGRQK